MSFIGQAAQTFVYYLRDVIEALAEERRQRLEWIRTRPEQLAAFHSLFELAISLIPRYLRAMPPGSQI